MAEYQKILIIQTAFIGDVILTTPLVKVLHEYFPSTEIHFLTIPSSKNILETNPYIKRLIIYDKKGKERGMKNFLNLVNDLKKENYDVALIPHRSLRSALLAWLAGIEVRIGFNKGSGKWFHSQVLNYDPTVHEYIRNLHLLSYFEIIPDLPIYPDIFFSEEDHSVVSNWLNANGIVETERMICLAPGSVWNTKRWLPERYAQLAKEFASFGYRVLLIGGYQDIELCNQIVEMSDENAISTAGIFTLRQSAELISRAEIIITNDSAPLHLGVAVKTPVLAIFGSTLPEFGFYPYGPHDRVLEVKNLFCRPCGIHGRRQCPEKHFRCMREITVFQVFQAAVELLKSARS